MGDSNWSLRDHTAQLTTDLFEASLDVLNPQNGLAQIRFVSVDQPGRILQTSIFSRESATPDASSTSPQGFDPSHVDAHVRGADLIAQYAEVQHCPFASQIYWSEVAGTESLLTRGAIDLTGSVETNLLDSQVEIRVASSLPAKELLRLSDADSGAFEQVDANASASVAFDVQQGACCILFRLLGDSSAQGESRGLRSYAQIVVPSDLSESIVQFGKGDVVRVEHRLFGQHLEKGVILRTRVRGVFLDRDGDMQAAAAWFRALSEEKPPLTT